MALIKHKQMEYQGKVARIYFDSEWEEYQVQFFQGTTYLGEEADHHTDCKIDAIETAQVELQREWKAVQKNPTNSVAQARGIVEWLA